MKSIFRRKRPPNSVLGLAFDGSHVEAALGRRMHGSLQIHQSTSAVLSLNLLSAEPELAGRELRECLTKAGLRERHCVVGLPVHWALVLQTQLPDLPEDDLDDLLQTEAERGFAYPLETLFISKSICRAGAGGNHATVAAIPRTHIIQLQKVLKAARLQPLSFTLSVAALQDPRSGAADGMLAFHFGESHAELEVCAHGGVAALRALDLASEHDGVVTRLPVAALAPAIKISLGQLPAAFRSGLKKARVFGRSDAASEFAQAIGPNVLGVPVEWARSYDAQEFGARLLPESPVTAARSLAAGFLSGCAPAYEFLPPKQSKWGEFSSKVSSKKLAWASAAAASVAALATGAFLLQQWELTRLQTQWAAIEPKVKELENLQQQIRRFRPWFNASFPSLSMLRALTEAFPAEGSVTAKTVEVRNGGMVMCSGSARDNQALLTVLDKLRGSKEVANLKIDQVRGKSPMQFSFDFQWIGGPGNED